MRSEKTLTVPGGLRLLRAQTTLVVALGLLALLAVWAQRPTPQWSVPLQHYLPLHSLLEFLSIAAAFLVFATVWHTPVKKVSASWLIIAMALFASGWLDFFHMHSYKGMPELVSPSSIEKAIAFWLAARALVAGTLLGVSFYPQMRPLSQRNKYLVLAAYTAFNAVVLVVVLFFESSLPATFQDGVGLTRLKVQVEWCITGVLAWSAWRYYRLAQRSGSEFAALIFGASSVAVLSEAFFTGYAGISDALNLTGHLYKIVGYGLMYRAMFVISVRKPYDLLAEQAHLLTAANATLRTQALALDFTTAPVFVTDPQGRVQWRNRASYQIFPRREEDEGVVFSMFAPPFTPDAAAAARMRDTVFAGKSWRGLVVIEDRHGNHITVDRTVTPLRNEDGILEGFVSVSEDVTETRRALERHKRVLSTAIDGFWIADVEGNLMETNAAFARMSGYGTQELAGMNVRQLGPSSRITEVQERMAKAARLGHDQFETRLQHKQGRDVMVALSVTFDPQQQQFFVFLRDITEQMQTAAVKLDLERQLQQSQKMEALGQLTGGIAHDFNNILVSVLGYSKLALDRLVPDKQSKLATYLREVITASERARDLVAKMLVFTRTKSNANKVGAISPGVVVQEALAMVRPSMPSSIRLDVQLDDDVHIWMDAGELNQVLINLIINARDAIDGPGVIGLRLHRIDATGKLCAASQLRLAGSYLALDVTDTGSGIAPEHRQRLFDPFFTTKEVGKGTGLGLSMVQGIVLRSGGHIVVESQPGQGSLFQLLFPVTSALPAVQGVLADDLDLLCGQGQHVCVVDDEPAVTGYLCELLQGHGYRVTPYNHPAQALAAVESAQQVFDLIIADQTMPMMSGMELAKRLHALQPSLPVILCTGHAGALVPTDLRQARIRHCFTKPVPTPELLRAMAQELAAPVAQAG